MVAVIVAWRSSCIASLWPPAVIIDKPEHAPPAPPPKRHRALALLAAQRRRALVEQAEDDRAVVVGQLDQASLHDEAAKLDQLTRSLAAFHNPVAPIIARDRRQQATPRRRRAPTRRARRVE